jgi:DNA primase
MRDRDLVERVRDATDLAALVGQAVKLRKQGSAFVGLCPFHAERSPSFQVVPARGFYHCFGCGKHGDAFAWLMEREGLSFPEALEQLAGAAGIEVPKVRERPAAEVDQEARLRGVLEAAQAWFQRQLAGDAGAQAYLRSRGITESFAREAGFGVAPEGWEGLVGHLRGLGISPDLAEQAGLASRTERGTVVDFLRGRLTIPIHDGRGRLVAFGGRILGEGQPKYMNTRETALFRKGETLFGFQRAKGAAKDGLLVVEGYFDVLQLHQSGIAQAVAPLGTALTEEHLKLAARFTKRLVLCFDGDAAGRRAMEKSLRLALPLGFDLRLLELPQGEDPDTWCLAVGPEAFRELIRQAPDWTAFVLAHALEGRDLRRAPDRMAAFQELLVFLPFLPDTPERRELLASLAHQLQLPRSEVERAVRERRTVPRSAGAQAGPERAPALDELLRPLVLLAWDPASRPGVADLPHAWWEGLDGAPLLQAVLDAEGDEARLPEDALAQVRRLEGERALRDETPPAPRRVFSRLESAFVHRELQAVNRQLLDPRILGDEALKRRLEDRQVGLLRRKSDLARQLRVTQAPAGGTT